MTTRIRYKLDTTTGLYVSKPVHTSNDLVTVTLNTTNLTATVTGTDGSQVSEPLTETSLPKLKSYVKNFLIGLGALFNDEVRHPRTTRTTETTSEETTSDVA